MTKNKAWENSRYSKKHQTHKYKRLYILASQSHGGVPIRGMQGDTVRIDWWDYPWPGVGLKVRIGCATTCIDHSSRLFLGLIGTGIVELAKSMHFGLIREKLFYQETARSSRIPPKPCQHDFPAYCGERSADD